MHIKEDKNKEAVILAGIDKYKTFLQTTLKMPVSFAELGAKVEDISYLVDKLFEGAKNVGNFKQLTKEDAANIYRLAAK